MRVFKVCAFSDIHFDSHDKRMWAAFKRFHRATKPDLTVAVGDIIEGAVASDYPPESTDSPYIAHDLQVAAMELNELGGGIILDGNHDVRLHKRLGLSQDPIAMKGLVGLTFSEQMAQQGLSRRWKWVFEDNHNYGFFLGRGNAKTLFRHGDHQFPRGGPKHVAHAMQIISPHVNNVFGHCHREQVFCQTSLGSTYWTMSLGTFQSNRNYQKDPNWQRGFGLIYYWGANKLDLCTSACPVPVLWTADGFCVEGRVYG